jgi:hypothetical protein
VNWFVVIQERAPYNGRFPREDFRAWRKYSVWPKTFATENECAEFLDQCFKFKGLEGAKISASAMSQAQFRNVTWQGDPYRRRL